MNYKRLIPLLDNSIITCFQSKTEIEYLINYCLASSEQYLSYMQAKNKISKKKNYIEMRTGMAQQEQRLLSATGKIWRFG